MSAAIVMTTVPPGDTLIASLVDSRLAACVQELPITSTYRWEGEVRTDGEILLLIKTQSDRVGEVQAHLQQYHPYDVPEILIIDDLSGSSAYLDWLTDETRQA